MIDVLRFWRDVEIFNIPDAPSPKNPAGSGNPPPVDDEESDLFPDSQNTVVDAVDSEEGEILARPRSRVVQRFPARADLSADRNAAFPPLLPWCDSRFQVSEETGRPSCESESSESESDGGPPPPASYAHAVYLGVGPKQRFVEFILRTNALEQTPDETYRPATGEGWLAAFIVDAAGVPLPKTYLSASFAVGSGVLLERRSLDSVSAELQERSAAFDRRMDERYQILEHDHPEASIFPLTWDDLVSEWEGVHQPLGGTDDFDEKGPLGPFIVVQSVPLYRRKDGSLNPPPAQAATFLNSFFIDDLTTLIQGGPAVYSAALAKYLGPDSLAAERIDLLADPKALADHVSPDLLPAGRWVAPPNEHLALAQQAAVYQIVHQIGQTDGDGSRGLMAVNGPPGTGKTTLLKDVIAQLVVERAKRLSALDDPTALFTNQLIQARGGDDKRPDAPAIRADIVAGTEIVVTSSNNAAVQNISFELPFSRDSGAFPDASYLPEVAALVANKFRLQRKNPLGLLAAALGAKPNREKIATALMGFEKAVDLEDPETHPHPDRPASLKPWLDLARRRGWGDKGVAGRKRWNQARADFQKCLADVEAVRAELTELNEAIRELPELPKQRERLQSELHEQRGAEASMQVTESARQAERVAADGADQAALQALAHRHAALDIQCGSLLDKLKEVRDLNEPGWFARGLKKIIGFETEGYRNWKREVRAARAAVDAADAELTTIGGERNRIAQQLTVRAQHADQASRAHEALARALTAQMAESNRAIDDLNARESELQKRVKAARSSHDFSDDRPCLPDDDFFSMTADEQHLCSLWVSNRLDQARAELFVAALRLHEATLMATAASWFKVLRVVRDVLSGNAQPVTSDDLLTIWRSLFFVVPVVSTTLASFGRLFQDLGRESLGWVLIDEAGQATPASVAGALWRARRAVIVGDPLQIEPVVTAPRKLVERLGENNGMDHKTITRWSPSVQSAQTLADRSMRLGAMVGDVWTGLPLRTHRRCMSPMFEIANRIAYDDQMVQATTSKDVQPDLFKSCWIDVRGKAVDKVVEQEVDTLGHILETLLVEWPQVVNGKGEKAPASVYVNSPFRDVAAACKERIGPDSSLGRRFARQKLLVDAGTVHTFQGKEASIVFLVLGSASGDVGAGSRRWAASKPNLLNVAVTRAQQRFYVIGNYADWTELPFFSELAQKAKHMPRTRIEYVSATGRMRFVATSVTEPIAQ